METKAVNSYPLAEEEVYQDGQTIFAENSSGDWVYVVLSGQVEISKKIKGQRYIIAILKPGEVFGELAFFSGIKRTASATARGKTTVGIIDRSIFEKEFNQLSSQLKSIIKLMAVRYKGVLERTSKLSTRHEPRSPKVISVVFKNKKTFVKSYTENAGMGGIFIKTENLLPLGHQFLLKLKLPGVEEPIEVESEVIWSRKKSDEFPHPPGMGIKFNELPEKSGQILRAYLRK